MLPSKVKDEKELENEGLFTCKEPEDYNSHGLVLRESASDRKAQDERIKAESQGSDHDDEDADEDNNIAINLNEEPK